MKSYQLLAGILNILLISCAPQKPVLQLAGNHISLDTIPAGSTAKTSVSFQNIGNADMVIEDYRIDCECTQINLQKNERIKPGETYKALIEVSADSVDIGKLKNVSFTIKTNTQPALNNITMQYFVK